LGMAVVSLQTHTTVTAVAFMVPLASIAFVWWGAQLHRLPSVVTVPGFTGMAGSAGIMALTLLAPMQSESLIVVLLLSVLVTIGFGIVLSKTLPNSRLRQLIQVLPRYAIVLCSLPVLLLLVKREVPWWKPVKGAKAAAAVLEEEAEIVKSFVLVEETSSANPVNPQFNYYTKGWLNNTRPTMSATRVLISGEHFSSQQLLPAAGASWIVLTSMSKQLPRDVQQTLGATYSIVTQQPPYYVFRLK
jgi:hypothetical protein